MFPRQQRLTQKKLFDTIFKRGTWIRGRSASIVVLPSRQSGQIGFIVTKKIAKSAVKRNVAKRRIRAAFLHVFGQPEFKSILNSVSIVVVINRVSTEQPFDTLVKEAEAMLKKIVGKQESQSA